MLFAFTTADSNYIFFTVKNGLDISFEVYGTTANLYFSRNTMLRRNVNDNVWRHFVWTISADGTWKYYFDGVLIQTDVGKGVPNSSLRTKSWLGKSPWGNPPFNGLIDDFRIYNTDLSATDVASLYQYTGILLSSSLLHMLLSTLLLLLHRTSIIR